MSRFLVTGVAGFIGSHIATVLAQRGDFVLGVDRAPKAETPTPSRAILEATGNFRYQPDGDLVFARHGDEAYLADMIPRDLIPELLPGDEWRGAFDFAFLCAGVNYWKYPANDGLATDYEQITDAGIGGLKLAAMLGIKHAAYMSSAEVFGERSKYARDDAERSPLSTYGAAHIAVEDFGNVWARNNSRTFAALRLPLVYGPRESQGSPVRLMFESLASFLVNTDPLRTSEPYIMATPGDGLRTLDPLYISDVTDGAISLADAILGERYGFGTPGEPLGFMRINFGSIPRTPFEITNSALATLVASTFDLPRRKAGLQVQPMLKGSGDEWVTPSRFTLTENEALFAGFAQNTLSWFPKVPPSVGILSVADHFKGEPVGKV
jgi:UDP-glucuronate 4-epimerase